MGTQVLLPKQDVKLTLVLSGIRAPRTARNASEKSEPFGQEAYDFTVRKALQRDAEIEVESTDKSGGALQLTMCDTLTDLLKQASSARCI